MENLIVVFSKIQSNLTPKLLILRSFFSSLFYDENLFLSTLYVVSVYTKIIHISGEIFNRFYRFLLNSFFYNFILFLLYYSLFFVV